MKAAYLTQYGGNNMIGYGELPAPVIKHGSVIVDVHAAGMNPVEIAMREGEFKRAIKFKFPQVMGFDISGVIRQVGSGVNNWKQGDEVFARMPNRLIGAYAEQALLPADLLAVKPANLTHLEAAGLPTIALTTWQGLVERAHLKAGERILIQAGAGGVGSFAIQLAKHLGAVVAATAGPANQSFLKDLGADITIDYKQQRFEDFGPFDVVYDGVGGALIERSIDVLRAGGRYVGLVRTADAEAYRGFGIPAPLAWLAARRVASFQKRARMRGAQFHGILTRPDGPLLARIGAIFESGAIKPVVGKVFELSEIRQAYQEMAGGHARGKIVIQVIAQC
jgi:NADPH:quinone reductase-like Zn-dependent oxidoreductase